MSNQIIKSDNHDSCEVMNSRSLSDVTRGLSKKKTPTLTFLTWDCFSAIIVQTSDTYCQMFAHQCALMVANGNSLYVWTYFAINQFLILVIIGKELDDFIL